MPHATEFRKLVSAIKTWILVGTKLNEQEG